MDRLVDHLFVFEGDGVVSDFPGNYSLYREQSKIKEEAIASSPQAEVITPKKSKEEDTTATKKLSFKEKREFEILGKEIRALENEKSLVNEKLNSGNIPFEELQQLSRRIGEITSELDAKEIRWLELSEYIS
jgi:ATP-binding cassette subfamily F protein uup